MASSTPSVSTASKTNSFIGNITKRIGQLNLSLRKKKTSVQTHNSSSENLSSNASNNSINTTRRKTNFKRRTTKASKDVQVYDNLLKQLKGNNIEDYWQNYNDPYLDWSDLKLEKLVMVVFKGHSLYVKFTRNIDEIVIGLYVDKLCSEECCNLSYKIDTTTFSINSILFENKNDSSCRGISGNILSGTFYIEFIMSLILSLLKLGLEIKLCQLEDAAFIKHPITKNEVNLSIIKLFEDCRTFYEGYGFFPSLGYATNDLTEHSDYEFMSDDYINALRILVNDRIIFFSKPILRIIKLIKERKLFRINKDKLLNVNLYSDEDTYSLAVDELETLYKLAHDTYLIKNNASLNDIYEYAIQINENFLLGYLIGIIEHPLENICGDRPYYFPISTDISPEKIDSVIGIYSKKQIQIYEKPIRSLFRAVSEHK